MATATHNRFMTRPRFRNGFTTCVCHTLSGERGS